MLTTEYMMAHAAEMTSDNVKLTAFLDISDDSINKPFFDSLPAETKRLIELRKDIAAVYGIFLPNTFTSQGVEINSAEYSTADKDVAKSFSDMAEMVKPRLIELLKEYNANKRSSYSRMGL
jgi:hypothetical protein